MPRHRKKPNGKSCFVLANAQARTRIRRGQWASVEMFLSKTRAPTIREMKNQKDADKNPPREAGAGARAGYLTLEDYDRMPQK